MVEREGEPLGDGVVAEVPVLEREVRAHVREVLRVPGLVQQHAVVVLPAVRQHDEVDLVRYAHGRAEGARRLELADLGVEVHVGLGVEVDAQPGERAPQRRDERVALEDGVEALGAPQAGQVGEVELRERDAEALAHQAVHDALVETLGVGEEPLELGAQVVVVETADRAVQLLVVRVAEFDARGRDSAATACRAAG